ncbi:MAG: acetyl-CoA carboxylase biotin carboxyl carrier protein subunit [Rikenellaceae bacterium]|jgi:biotin carboxyl carrier protein|nr:acetyl-CoA carboxylase biotin carboxyl carrier protein subunit [Rikenellaceae bacterium]
MKQYKFKINGTEYAVDIIDVEGDKATVAVNGSNFEIEVEGLVKRPVSKTPKVIKPAAVSVASAPAPERKAAPASASGAAAGAIKAPLPGVILSIDVKVGEMVKVGQRLLVLEAMKMENNIDSDREGIVREIKVGKGDSVLEGDVIMTIG